ncbi:MAG: InlB B-repeat-containing protein [Clostridia bacterium]|nr:InlB B-repeat-containing protein [Clostridia bacterium]
MRIKYFILSAIILVVVAVSGVLLYSYWPAITGTINNSKYYTSEDLQNSYDDGFEDGCNNYNELTTQVDYYKELTDVYYLQILDLQDTVNTLETTNKNNTQTIADLEAQKQILETDVENLQSIKTENEETITNLNLQISSLQTRVDELTADKTANQNQIDSLNTQIANLQTLNTQLQKTNELNAETITSLNNQIDALNSQISSMHKQIQNNSANVTALNNKIADLEKSIAYYEQYIANLENGEQVVATFEFDGSVYNIQILNKNGYASVVNPSSTEKVIFNGWTVNGEAVDLSTYQITTNTKFIADVTYNNLVKFLVDDEEVSASYVVKNQFATAPTTPIKDGYVFDGWTVDGDIIDISNYSITSDTTFIAKFTKLHTVKLMDDFVDGMTTTLSVRDGSTIYDIYASGVTPGTLSISSAESYNLDVVQEIYDSYYGSYKGYSYIKVLGWFVNDTEDTVNNPVIIPIYEDVKYSLDWERHLVFEFIVDDEVYGMAYFNVEKEEMVEQTFSENPTKENHEFVSWEIDGEYNEVGLNRMIAVFEAYPVVEFMVDDTVISTQNIQKNSFATLPTEPIKDGYSFTGWSINGSDLIDISAYTITEDTVFIAVFESLSTVKFMVDDVEVSNQKVIKNQFATAPTTPIKDGYAFDGWSVDGINIVDIDTYLITSDTTFIALFRVVGTIKYGTLSIGGSTSGSIYSSDVIDGKIYLYANSRFGIFDVTTDTLEETSYTIPFSPYCMTVYQGKVYFGGSKGAFAYFDISTKTMSANIGLSISNYFYSLVGYGDNIYLGGTKGAFAIYNISSGSLSNLIDSPYGDGAIRAMAVYDDKIYMPDGNGNLAYYNILTGTFSELIATPITTGIYTNIDTMYLFEDKLYIAGNYLCIYDLKTETFSELFQPIGNNSGSRMSEIVYVGNNTMFIVGLSGKFFAYDIQTNTAGELIKIPNFYKQVTSTSSQTKNIYSIVYHNNKLYLFGASCNYAIYGV